MSSSSYLPQNAGAAYRATSGSVCRARGLTQSGGTVTDMDYTEDEVIAMNKED